MNLKLMFFNFFLSRLRVYTAAVTDHCLPVHLPSLAKPYNQSFRIYVTAIYLLQNFYSNSKHRKEDTGNYVETRHMNPWKNNVNTMEECNENYFFVQ